MAICQKLVKLASLKHNKKLKGGGAGEEIDYFPGGISSSSGVERTAYLAARLVAAFVIEAITALAHRVVRLTKVVPLVNIRV